jgi:hypothetical protein
LLESLVTLRAPWNVRRKPRCSNCSAELRLLCLHLAPVHPLTPSADSAGWQQRPKIFKVGPGCDRRKRRQRRCKRLGVKDDALSRPLPVSAAHPGRPTRRHLR